MLQLVRTNCGSPESNCLKILRQDSLKNLHHVKFRLFTAVLGTFMFNWQENKHVKYMKCHSCWLNYMYNLLERKVRCIPT